jgi:hypothetical protein
VGFTTGRGGGEEVNSDQPVIKVNHRTMAYQLQLRRFGAPGRPVICEISAPCTNWTLVPTKNVAHPVYIRTMWDSRGVVVSSRRYCTGTGLGSEGHQSPFGVSNVFNFNVYINV